MKKTLYILCFLFMQFFQQIFAEEIYNCNRICGFCEDDSCCRSWKGYIKSTDDPKIYIWTLNENAFNKTAIKDESCFFYKTDNYSDWNLNKYDEYITKFDNNEQQILTINRENRFTSFNDGADNVVECFLINK